MRLHYRFHIQTHMQPRISGDSCIINTPQTCIPSAKSKSGPRLEGESCGGARWSHCLDWSRLIYGDSCYLGLPAQRHQRTQSWPYRHPCIGWWRRVSPYVSSTTLCSSCQHLVIQKPFKKTINLAPVMLKSQYLMDRRDVNWAPLILLTAFHQKSEETALFFPPCPRLWLLILPSKISFDGRRRQITRNMGCCSTRPQMRKYLVQLMMRANDCDWYSLLAAGDRLVASALQEIVRRRWSWEVGVQSSHPPTPPLRRNAPKSGTKTNVFYNSSHDYYNWNFYTFVRSNPINHIPFRIIFGGQMRVLIFNKSIEGWFSGSIR